VTTRGPGVRDHEAVTGTRGCPVGAAAREPPRVGARKGRSPRPRRLTPERARALAELVHGGTLDRYGSPLVQHVSRVAAGVAAEARTVAWLHETLEQADVSERELRAAGASDDEVAAVRLLTREHGADEATYLAHIRRIARAAGEAGRLARIVKRVDLSDRATHVRAGAGAPAHPPYARALAILSGKRVAAHG
jgi:hypothetical protein